MKMKNILAVCLLFFTSAVAASQLGDKFSKTAEAFAEAGRTRQMEGAVLAVFPFQTDEKLSRKKVDFAVGELLANHLLKQGFYKITERAQLEEVLKEQKLGLTGAVDSRTASGIGKIVGARLLVLGNVVRMGNSYQITAKLVEAETAEMLASQVIEVPVETFDQEAGRYLALVPERQAVGVFIGLGYGIQGDSSLPPQAYDGTLTLTPGNESLPQGIASIGVRYSFKPRWIMQFDYSSVFTNIGGVAGSLYTANLVPISSSKFRTGYKGLMLRALVSRNSKLSERIAWHNGVGLSFSSLDNVDRDNSDSRTEYPGGYVVTVDSTNNTKFFTPFLRTGLEWRPQERFGWGLFANLNLLSKEYKQGVEISKSGSPQREVILWKGKLPTFYLETSVALYF